MPYKVNPFTGQLDYYEDADAGGGGTPGAVVITHVANYSDLPTADTASLDTVYVADAAQGTSWLPGSLGGTYYPAGAYYSNGVSWIYYSGAYQATLSEVNTGTNTDKFVTPSTFTNATKWSTKFNVPTGTTSEYLRGDGSIATFPTKLNSSVLEQDVKLGENISIGHAVYTYSANGTNIIVKKASNDTESTSSKTLGLLKTSGVLNDQRVVITEGLISGLDTSTATVGDAVWLGTAGDLIYGISNKPVAPAHLVYLGVVTRVNNSNGEIFVKVQNGFEIDELHDVSVTGRADNYVLGYVSSTGLHMFKSIITWLGFTPENIINKSTSVTTDSSSDTKYPSVKSVYDWSTGLFVQKNSTIVSATKTKITYDSKGLVTGGLDATTADIADSTNKRYVTDAQLVVVGNTSGTNTGDETTSTIKTKLGITTLSGSNTGDQDLSGLQPLDSDLTAIAALTTTSYGRDLLTQANASSVRTYIGAGTGNGDALTSGKLSQFASTTSAELAGVISDETGSDKVVFSNAPTLVNPIVGTQTQGDNSTKAASTAYVDTAVASVSGGTFNYGLSYAMNTQNYLI